MSQVVTADITMTLNVSDVATGGTLASADVVEFQESVKLNYGGSNPASIGLEWSALLTFVGSTPQTLDLTSLPGPRGATITLASCRAVYIYNLAATAGYVLTVGGGSNPFTPGWSTTSITQSVPAGSRLLWENADTTPWTVDSTHKTLKLDPGSNGFTARVIILGS